MSSSSATHRFKELHDLRGSFLGANNAGIYLVEDAITGKLCIEKRLKLFDIEDGYAKREIEVLHQLRYHPNISHLVDFTLDEEGYMDGGWPSATIWTEYCTEGSLQDVIFAYFNARESIPEAFLWHVLASLAEAVRYCQSGTAALLPDQMRWNLVYHRDIQPCNVFLTLEGCTDIDGPYPRVVLGDFGCSTTLQHIACGDSHPLYVSRQDSRFEPPEAPAFNMRSDIWQIGMVLYCLIFVMDAPIKRWDPVKRIREEPAYSSQLKELVCRCMEEDCEKRIGVEELVLRIEMAREKLNV